MDGWAEQRAIRGFFFLSFLIFCSSSCFEQNIFSCILLLLLLLGACALSTIALLGFLFLAP